MTTSDLEPGGPLRRYTGGCHCGGVRFDIEAPAALEVVECNCSICSKAGYRHVISED